MAELPLLRRYPALSTLPRASLGEFPTPVHRITLHDGRELLLKRDDRSGQRVGGNKLRGLEWLLGDLRPGQRVVTVGSLGSTHALATAVHGRALGAKVTVVRWNQELNPAAREVEMRLREEARVIDARSVAAAFVVAAVLRLRGDRWIPAGGACPAAVLGHVNAALELSAQISADEIEIPESIVVPLGTGTTAAGIALGLRLAGMGIRVIAVRVVPRIVGRAPGIIRMADKCAALIEGVTGERLPRVSKSNVVVEHAFYAGAYGRALPDRSPDEDALRALGIRLDDTYSRKAFAAAARQRNHRTLLWLTFDGRLLQNPTS